MSKLQMHEAKRIIEFSLSSLTADQKQALKVLLPEGENPIYYQGYLTAMCHAISLQEADADQSLSHMAALGTRAANLFLE